MTLKEKMYEYTFITLKKNKFHRTKTCKELDVSLRTLRTYCADMRTKGYKIPEVRGHYLEPEYIYTGFATQDERFKQLGGNFTSRK